MKKTLKVKRLQRNHGVIVKHQTFQLKLNHHIKDAGRQCVVELGPSPDSIATETCRSLSTQVREGSNNRSSRSPSEHYKSVGKGVGDSCSFGAYLAKKGKKTVSMTPTMASM